MRFIFVLLAIAAPWCAAADAPPKVADPHEHLKQILERPMYQTWRLRENGNLPDIKLPETGAAEWLKAPLRAIRDFFDWLFNARGRGGGWSMPSAGSMLPTALRAFAWCAVAVAVIFIIVLLIRALSNSKAPAMAAHVLSRQQIHESLQSGDALALAASEWMEEADRLADENNFRAVYRALYLALLSGLHTLGKIEHSRHRTNWAYVRQYRGPDGERAAFRELTELFERVWYGRKAADHRNLDELRRSVASLTAPRGTRMIRRIIFGATVALLVMALVLFYRSVASSIRGIGDVPVYSVQRYDPYGTAALRDLLSERGIDVRTLDRPVFHPSDHGVLIQVLPIEQSAIQRGHFRISTNQLGDWLAAGNTVIQLCRAETELMTRLKVATTQPVGDVGKAQEHERRGDPPLVTPARVVQARTDAGRPLVMWSPLVFQEQKNESWKPLAFLPGEPERVVAGEMQVSGGGRAVWIGSPTPALNGMLAEGGNLEFLLALIGNGPVILDEWSHGIGREATIVGFLHEVGLAPLLLQVVVIAILYVWSTSGYPREDRSVPLRQRSSIEQIQTLGYLYNRSFNPDVTYERVNAEAQSRLAGALRCQPHEIAVKAALLKPELRTRFEELSAQLLRLRPEHGPRCLGCGYDLYLCASDRCPECGTMLAPEMLRRVQEASRGASPGGDGRHRAHSAFASVLTLSHQLMREVERDRRAL